MSSYSSVSLPGCYIGFFLTMSRKKPVCGWHGGIVVINNDVSLMSVSICKSEDDDVYDADGGSGD